jgi:hypothetical protein
MTAESDDDILDDLFHNADYRIMPPMPAHLIRLP